VTGGHGHLFLLSGEPGMPFSDPFNCHLDRASHAQSRAVRDPVHGVPAPRWNRHGAGGPRGCTMIRNHISVKGYKFIAEVS
jgi:hypothetical protein